MADLALVNVTLAALLLIGAVALLGLRVFARAGLHPIWIRADLILLALVGLLSATAAFAGDASVSELVRMVNAFVRGSALLLTWTLVVYDVVNVVTQRERSS